LSLQGAYLLIMEVLLTCGCTIKEGIFSNRFAWFQTVFSVHHVIAGRIHSQPLFATI